jgi:signal transduction histidine kinase
LWYSQVAATNLNSLGRLVGFLTGPTTAYNRSHTEVKPPAQERPAPQDLRSAGTLNKTYELRRSAFEMVVHDIRSPLMSAQVSIDLVEEFSLQISDPGYTAMQSARRKIESTLARAKSLLGCLKNKSLSEDPELEAISLDCLRFDLPKSSLVITRAMSCLTGELRTELVDAVKFLQRFEFLEGRRLSGSGLKHLARAFSGINRSIALIKDLLKTEACADDSLYLEKSLCPVAEIAEDAVSSLKSLADRKHIKIVQKGLNVSIQADRSRIAQVLTNFLSNAIKFSPEATEIVLSCQVLENSIKLAVTDEGPGISTDSGRHIFEKFSQVCSSDDKQGWGLGLFICKLIAEAHGGRVGLDSSPGCGSTFWLILPR